jgi:DNA repair exonuclease SbcCD ATPase subunit
LSEKETKDAVASATTEVDATKQRIQTDSYNVNDAISKIETLNSSLETLDKNSTTYKEVQASIAALTSIKESSEARLQQNVELQKAQKALLAELSAIQNNAVKVNAAAAVDLLTSSKEAQANLDQQADVLGKEVTTLEDQVKKIEELLTRISKDSPDYAQLVSTRDSLVSSIKQVKVEQEEVKEAARKSEELAEEAKKETLPSRLESSILGKILEDDEKPGVVNFKAKKVNAKFSEITTKLVDSSDEDLAGLGLEADDLEGLKISLKSGKKTIKVNNLELNEDGTLSFRIPRATKSGTYTMSVDIPDSDDDLSLKVKIRN